MEVSKRLEVSWTFIGSRNDFHDLERTRVFQGHVPFVILFSFTVFDRKSKDKIRDKKKKKRRVVTVGG